MGMISNRLFRFDAPFCFSGPFRSNVLFLDRHIPICCWDPTPYSLQLYIDQLAYLVVVSSACGLVSRSPTEDDPEKDASPSFRSSLPMSSYKRTHLITLSSEFERTSHSLPQQPCISVLNRSIPGSVFASLETEHTLDAIPHSSALFSTVHHRRWHFSASSIKSIITYAKYILEWDKSMISPPHRRSRYVKSSVTRVKVKSLLFLFHSYSTRLKICTTISSPVPRAAIHISDRKY